MLGEVFLLSGRLMCNNKEKRKSNTKYNNNNNENERCRQFVSCGVINLPSKGLCILLYYCIVVYLNSYISLLLHQ